MRGRQDQIPLNRFGHPPGAGDAQTTDKKDAEYNAAAKDATKTAAEAAIEGAQLPGTSSGGDIGLKPEDGASAVVTTLVVGGEVKAAKKNAEEAAKKQHEPQGKNESEKPKQDRRKNERQRQAPNPE